MLRQSYPDKTERQVTLFAMNKITQDMRFKQVVIEYSFKHGVTKAAFRYKTSRQNIYRWRKKHDGTIRSLADRSHRPHSHPNQHTAAEIKLICDMRRRNPHTGLVVFWVKLRQRGYTRSISGLHKLSRPDQRHQPQSISQNHTNRCNTPASVCRSTSNSSLRPVSFVRKMAQSGVNIISWRNTAVSAIWRL